MEKIRYDYDLQFFRQGPHRKTEVMGNIYELTDEEERALQMFIDAEKGDRFYKGDNKIGPGVEKFSDEELEILKSVKKIKNNRALKLVNLPETKFDNGIVGILKDNIEALEKLRKDCMDKITVGEVSAVTDISQQINITVSNLLAAYRQAGITQQEE